MDFSPAEPADVVPALPELASQTHASLSSGPPAILVERLTKKYDKLTAVDDISFMVPRGEFFGFLGPNGAGKSTTIRVLCGLARADYQRIQIAGRDLRSEPLGVKASIGVMLEEPVLYERLSAREHLRFTGQLYGLSEAAASARSEELLSLLAMADYADRMIVDYSQGMRKKTALACAMIHRPPVMFLDEPFNGIDTVSARQIKDLLRRRVEQEGVTILFSSHVMEVVEKLCTGVAIIHKGRIVLSDTMAGLRARPGFSSMEDLFISAVGEQHLVGSEDASWLG
ncbi:ABC transporter ATP-binding protein [bacterium]|nr:ABC transporter ATP-binding protein [bacterium]